MICLEVPPNGRKCLVHESVLAYEQRGGDIYRRLVDKETRTCKLTSQPAADTFGFFLEFLYGGQYRLPSSYLPDMALLAHARIHVFAGGYWIPIYIVNQRMG